MATSSQFHRCEVISAQGLTVWLHPPAAPGLPWTKLPQQSNWSTCHFDIDQLPAVAAVSAALLLRLPATAVACQRLAAAASAFDSSLPVSSCRLDLQGPR